MNTIELIKDAAFFGGHIPNERLDECRNFFDNVIEKQLTLTDVVGQGEQLKALINTNTDVDLLSGHKARLLEYAPETFLVQYNHNGHTDWIEPYEVKIKSL